MDNFSILKELEENLAALQIELTSLDLAEFNLVAPAGATAGDRYPVASMTYLSRCSF